MIFEIIYTPLSLGHLLAIFDYIAEHGDPTTARLYTQRLEAACLSLQRLPLRGAPRDDIRPGMRTLVYRKSATIAFSVEGKAVVIHGIFKRGQDYAAILRELSKPADD